MEGLLLLLRTSSSVDDLSSLRANVIDDELKRRGIATTGTTKDRLERLVADNVQRNETRQANGMPMVSAENHGDQQSSSSSTSGELIPETPVLFPQFDALREGETNEQFLTRTLTTLGQLMIQTQRLQQCAPTRPFDLHTTPDVTTYLPTYAARTNECPRELIRNIERVAIQQKWSAGLHVPMAVSKLRGEAKDWHENTGVDHEDCWADWKKHFLHQFDKEESLSEWMMAIQSRVQQPDESLNAYIQGKLKLFRHSRFKGTVQDKVDAICAGIHNAATRSILWTRYSSLDDFLEAARVRQRYDEHEQSCIAKFGPRKAQFDSRPTEKIYSFQKGSGGRTEKQRAQVPFNTGSSQRRIMCYNCNGTGHFARDCKEPKTDQTRKAEALRSQSSTSTRDQREQRPSQVSCFLKSIDLGMPIVKANLQGNKCVSVCIDTGANVSIVNELAVPDGAPLTRYVGKQSINVLDRMFHPEYTTSLDITLGNTQIRMPEVIVSEHCPFDLLLGSDWRKAANVEVAFHPNNDVTIVTVDSATSGCTKVADCTQSSGEKTRGEVLIVSCCKLGNEEPSSETMKSKQNDAYVVVSNRVINDLDEDFMKNIEHVLERMPPETTADQRLKLRTTLITHRKAFTSTEDALGLCPHAEHTIELRDSIPVYSRPYRCSPAEREFMRNTVSDYIQRGIVRESESEYGAPTIVVYQPLHPTTSKRMVHDYRKLNAKTIMPAYPMPIIEDVIDEITSEDACYFSTMDVRLAYLTVRVRPEDVHKTAFVTPDGKYEYLRMSFGFCKAPQTMQKIMRKTFAGLKRTGTYLDDIGQGANTIDDSISLLAMALERAETNGLKLSLTKCQLVQTSVAYLGYVISSYGRIPDPKRVEAVDKFSPSTDAKHLYSFLQFANHYRKFVQDFSRITWPLRALLKKGAAFIWTAEHDKIVIDLKCRLKSPPILSTYCPKRNTIVRIDACQTGLGAILCQKEDGQERVVEFASRALNEHDRNLHSNVLECMSVHWALTEKFSLYLRGGPRFIVLTDNYSVVYLSQLGKMNRRFARWTLDLAEYDYEVQHRSGASNGAADALSRLSQSSAPTAHCSILTQPEESTDFKVPPSLACYAVILTEGCHLKELQGTDPDCQRLSKSIGKDKSKFILEDDVIIRTGHKDGKPIKQVVVPMPLRNTVLSMCHDESGHMDVQKTMNKAARRYWWPAIGKNIANYIDSCHTCKRINNRTVRPTGILSPRDIPTTPGTIVSLDHFGPLEYSDGTTHVLVCIDHATRYVDAKCVQSTAACHYINYMTNVWICRFGVPEMIISDQGRGFVNKQTAAFHHRLGIEHSQTTPYWPQANGLVERVISTIKQALRKMLTPRTDWTLLLPSVVFAINVSVQRSTGYSPFELMHGYQPRLPGELNLGAISLELSDADRLLGLAVNRQEARRNLEKAQAGQKLRYDQRHRPSQYQPGDHVYFTTGTRTDPLGPSYDGPYEILKFVNENTVRINRLVPIAGRLNTRTANIQQLRVCRERHEMDTRLDNLHVTAPLGLPSNDGEDSPVLLDEPEPTPSSNGESTLQPMDSTSPSNRPQRTRRPPQRLQDYVTDKDLEDQSCEGGACQCVDTTDLTNRPKINWKKNFGIVAEVIRRHGDDTETKDDAHYQS